jgi:hypothetical protein
VAWAGSGSPRASVGGASAAMTVANPVSKHAVRRRELRGGMG